MLLIAFTGYTAWRDSVNANIVSPDVYYREAEDYFESVALDASGGCLRYVGTAKPSLFSTNFALARSAYGITAS